MSEFNSIDEAIEDIKNGKSVIVVDDEDRENEGDIILAADKVSPEDINFLAKHARGMICVAITSERATALELELMDLAVRLGGDERIDRANEQGPVSVSARLSSVQMGTALSTYGPSPMHERSLEIAEQEFADIRASLDRIYGTDLPALRAALDEAGVPWTPGRGVPAGG